MSKEFLSTGEVAVLFSVTPDAVLKWIKSGKLPAIQTPGGHYRIHRESIPASFGDEENPSRVLLQNKKSLTSQPQYCWAYNAKSGEIKEDCQKCVVYQNRIKHCYEIVKLPIDVGHARKFCETSCEQCEFYHFSSN